jgi:hypothetical protein
LSFAHHPAQQKHGQQQLPHGHFPLVSRWAGRRLPVLSEERGGLRNLQGV